MNTVLSDKHVITRKKHRCFACLRTFEKGTDMRAQTCVDDGVYTVYSCHTCIELMDKFHGHFIDDSENVYPEGCVREAFRDYNVTNPEELLKVLATEKT